MFLDVLGDFKTFFFQKNFREQNFQKVTGKISKILEKKIEFFFLHFSMLLDILGCLGTFWGAGGGEAPCGGRRPPQEQEAQRASMFLYI